MDLLTILAKVAKKEELAADELTFVKDYKLPEDDENRIPKKRFDDINTKYKDSQKEVKRLEGELETSTEKVEELESGDLSEADKAKKVWDKEKKKIEKERDEAKEEAGKNSENLAKITLQGKISDLATKHKFSDSKYLSHLIKSGEVDLEDESSVDSFMEGLKKDSPKLFTVDAKPGAGSGEDGEDTGNEKFVEAKGKGDINAMLANAPEIE